MKSITLATLAALALWGCSDTVITLPPPDASATDAPRTDASSDVVPTDGGACATTVTPSAGVVVTDRGAVRGAREGGAWAYRAIPFAAPPVGRLRWRAPEPATCWTDTRDATQWGTQCPQATETGDIVGAEDCLQLNVWTPADTPQGTTLPVLFFIHGGGNSQGSAVSQLPDGTRTYDGNSLATRGPAVVVTVNYRLGALGFFAHVGLSSENNGHSGNYGLMDQIAALQWVQRNIRSFGGDPARVLAFGESAGAVDVCALLASPRAAGLFSRALMESGACVATALADEQTFGATRVMGTTCATNPDPIACLRGMPASEVVRAMPGEVDVARGSATQYKTVVDGEVLPAAPLELVRMGRHNHVPLVIGSNTDETSRASPAIASAMQYEALVRAQLPTVGNAALMQYPASAYASPRQAYIALTSDLRFVCSARRAARIVDMEQTEPVRRYVFGQRLTGPASAFGAWHGLELLFVFGQLRVSGYVPSAQDTAVSEAMQRYWVRFAATGDPNAMPDVMWPEFASSTDDHLFLGAPIMAARGVRTEQCDFWDRLIP